MASSDQDIRRELAAERERLAEAVGTLRSELGEATDIGGRLQAKLPLAAAGALGLGFVASGGIGATVRLLLRRGREGEPKAKAGRFTLVDKG
ncbi:MAG: hypothetical protein JWM06_2955 [Actinomycetia bacterium]|nr:hypothetical protein [Actinomycetes bacterium]